MKDDIQNMSGAKAQEKIKEIIDNNEFCMMLTDLNSAPIHTRPMAVKKVGEDGTLYFLSHRNSTKHSDIANDKRVQLQFMNTSRFEFLSLFGHADEQNDVGLKKELWESTDTSWFPMGPEDPALTVITVKPESGHFWDTKSGRVLTVLKMLASAITGEQQDLGVEGALKP